MGLAYRSYLRLATTVASYPLANGLLIFLCSLPLLLLESYYSQTRTRNRSKACRYYPLWLSFLLLASTAVDLPLVFALHPVTILYPTDPLDLPPSPKRLALQMLGFFLLEDLCRYLIQSLVLPMATKPYHAVEDHLAGDDIVTEAIVDFSTPRIALMLGVAAIGIPCRLTECLGRLHPLSMAAWLIVNQSLSTLARCKGR
ncbi:hypothetical protein BDW66DRAFT_142956 [Aspergillus desertorum]